MKIATVSPYDFSIPGGVNNYALELTRWLRDQGHDVRLIGPASARNGTTPKELTVVGRPRRIPAGGTAASLTLSLRLARTVRTLLEQEQFEIVHLHEPYMPLLPLHFLRFSNARNVGTFHAAEPLGRRLYRLAGPVLRQWARRLHARTAVSTVARDTARPGLGGSCAVIPCCTDVERFARPAAPPPPLDDGRRNILFVGRIEPRKGLRVLLDAYGRIRRDHADTRLVVVGPTDAQGRKAEARTQALGWDDVLFTGAVHTDDLPRYYQAAHVFCSPALGGEAFGIVLTEAMAAGAPVLASDIAGYRDVVRAGRDGLLVPPNDAAALASAIDRLLTDAALRDRLIEGGRVRARDFSVELVGRQMLDLYDRLLSGRLSWSAS